MVQTIEIINIRIKLKNCEWSKSVKHQKLEIHSFHTIRYYAKITFDHSNCTQNKLRCSEKYCEKYRELFV
jgi:hypothetical protein